MRNVFFDLRHAVRMALRRPGFAALATATLAIGIGGTTAIHGFVDGILLAPLPYQDPESLVVITRNHRGQGFFGLMLPGRDVLTIREQSQSFDALSGYRYRSVNLGGDGAHPDRVPAASALPDFLSLVGIEPALGRRLDPREHERGDAVVLISDRLWNERFGGTQEALGATIRLDGVAHTIAGVLPPGIELVPRPVDLVLPLSEASLEDDPRAFYWLVGRLSPESTGGAAHAEVNAILERWESQNQPPMGGWGADVEPLETYVTGDVRQTLVLLYGAVGLLLLIACANVSHLFLVQGEARQHEMRVRVALGARRGRLVGQLLLEGLLMATAGGVAGAAVASVAVELMLRLAPAGVPRIDQVGVDLRVLGFCALAAVAAGGLSSLLPAALASRPEPGPDRRATPRQRLAAGLTVAQVALSLTLSVAFGLLLSSFYELNRVDPGFDPRRLALLNVALPAHRYEEPEAANQAINEIVESASTLAFVESAAASTWAPMTGSWGKAQMSVEATSGESVEREAWPMILGVTPDYFSTIGLPLLRGRNFEANERHPDDTTAIVTESLAASAWPGVEPLGKRIKFGGANSENPWLTVVGVASDSRLVGLATEPQDGLFLPMLRNDRVAATVHLAVRTRRDPEQAVPALREAIWGVDPELPIAEVTTMDALLERNVSRSRFSLVLFAAFAVAALFVAGIGVYGVVAHAVARRRREIGLRIALGADRGRVVRLVLRRGVVLVVAGVLLGALLSALTTRLMAHLLFQVEPTSPPIFAAAVSLIVAMGTLASLLPARRAAALDPGETLRSE